MLASLKRAPFDLPEAESELVAGFHTEYTGFRFAVFFLAEYAAMILFALLILDPLPRRLVAGFPEVALDSGCRPLGRGRRSSSRRPVFLLFVMIWIRWSLPRFRIDKVMYLCYKVLLPLERRLRRGRRAAGPPRARAVAAAALRPSG